MIRVEWRGPPLEFAGSAPGTSVSGPQPYLGVRAVRARDVGPEEGKEELQHAIRDLLVEEMAAARQHPEGDLRQALDGGMDVLHRDPFICVPGHDQAWHVDLAQAAGHGIGIPAGHEPEYRTDVGRIAHETTIDVPGRRRHL
jgi:hypothetical protein